MVALGCRRLLFAGCSWFFVVVARWYNCVLCVVRRCCLLFDVCVCCSLIVVVRNVWLVVRCALLRAVFRCLLCVDLCLVVRW